VSLVLASRVQDLGLGLEGPGLDLSLGLECPGLGLGLTILALTTAYLIDISLYNF